MSSNPMEKKDLIKAYEEVSEDSGKFRELIEKNTMDPEVVTKILDGYGEIQKKYPELAAVDEMTGAEFSALYKKVAEEIKASPEAYEEHSSHFGMSPDELSNLLGQIAGGVEKYPEVWDSQEKAQLLRPKNLIMLAAALKEDTAEALGRIKGFSDK